MHPYDMEMGAATFHPQTALKSLGNKKWKSVFPTISGWPPQPSHPQKKSWEFVRGRDLKLKFGCIQPQGPCILLYRKIPWEFSHGWDLPRLRIQGEIPWEYFSWR